MQSQMNTLSVSENEAILTLCLLAAFADGEKHEQERAHLKGLTTSLGIDGVDLAALYQNVLLKKPDARGVAANLTTPGARELAYEMAVCVCDADGVCNDAEREFLDQLRAALALPASEGRSVETEAAALATLPVAGPEPPSTTERSEETDAMILRYAIVAGALELLPQTIATLAIVPMQTKMVYRIGSQRGVSLDRKAVVEFMGAVGIGLASQVFEGFARRLAGGLGKKVAGKMGGKIGNAAGGVAMSFGSTYALGKLAKLYYDGGRSLGMETLKAKYPPMLAEGKALATKYGTQIAEQSKQFQGASLSSILKGAA